MLVLLQQISTWSIPVLVVSIILYGYFKGVKVYDSFTDGAKNGLNIALKIFPYLLAMMVAINVFRASGAMDLLIKLLNPLTSRLGIPEQITPLVFLRPLSGSGSLSYISHIFQEHGPDSFIGILASTIQGSTETTFYIVAVYFGAIGIKKYRYAITVGLLADLAGYLAAVFICKILFLK